MYQHVTRELGNSSKVSEEEELRFPHLFYSHLKLGVYVVVSYLLEDFLCQSPCSSCDPVLGWTLEGRD